MQTGITITGDAVTGTLKYISSESWDAGTWPVAESSGNYLALKMDADEGAVVTVEIVNGVHGPVTLDSDMNIVLRIANKETQSIKIVTTVNGNSRTRTLTLNGLVLEESV